MKLECHQLKVDQRFITEPPHLPDLHLVCTLSLMYHSPVLIFTPPSFEHILMPCIVNPQTSLRLREHLLHSGDQAALITTAIIGTFQTQYMYLTFQLFVSTKLRLMKLAMEP